MTKVNKAWLLLVLGGLLEVAWAVGLKYAHGFTNLKWTLITLCIMVISFYCFGYALTRLEIGTAYAIYTGIGAVGTVIYGVAFLNEPMHLLKLFFVVLLIGSIIGLKVIAKE
ncbi:multidrug efflux SMR transporter [Macrococcus sp. DPC7161]|uniref:DMT family transporter n=1 Tax=Macrococcus sp. DPC7161 TaxID=2507060 RepID=UPI00100B6731|nr:multidrug efflux SMR transporter [Macrococcus sp. DPC7161]RXK17807.1 multidrug efflux SMR transporter [Macrococcus sp. DPC7161]